ncbi:MAG TPA: YbaB/EbfC family nucleoid-associated protein [Acidimicrobiales bacterium]|jgi:hypothetical protein|nr:YbaB/EbfC family nucleoid-associated protein [Acidimicrobiales bacterium]
MAQLPGPLPEPSPDPLSEPGHDPLSEPGHEPLSEPGQGAGNDAGNDAGTDAGADYGADAGIDLTSLLSQIGQVQQNLQDAQASAAAQVVEGSSGGGMVKVGMTGGLDFRSVTINPAVINPADPDLLSDLVLAAVRDAVEKANELQRQALGSFDPSAGLGGLGGLLGGPEPPG